MPYRLRINPKGGYDVVRIATGEVVSDSLDKHKAILNIAERKKAEGVPLVKHGKKQK